jgi:hypothetical protein
LINFPVLQGPLKPATFWRVAVASERDTRDPDVEVLRGRRVSAALSRGGYNRLSAPLVTWLTVAGIGLSLVTLGVIAFASN